LYFAAGVLCLLQSAQRAIAPPHQLLLLLLMRVLLLNRTRPLPYPHLLHLAAVPRHQSAPQDLQPHLLLLLLQGHSQVPLLQPSK
jgi:hypothetical protein